MEAPGRANNSMGVTEKKEEEEEEEKKKEEEEEQEEKEKKMEKRKKKIKKKRPCLSWHLRPSLLTDKTFCKHMSLKITEYLENNDTSDVSDSILWESFKAVMRGHIIAHEAALKKSNKT